MRTAANVPAADRVWWMAQVRARHSSIECAIRPIAIVEVAAVAVAALAGSLALIWVGPMLSSMLSSEWARAGGNVLESLVTAAVTGSTGGIAAWLSLAIAHAAEGGDPDAEQN